MPDPNLNASGKDLAVRAMFAEIAPSYDRLIICFQSTSTSDGVASPSTN
jgi:hypothetical protein